MVDEKAGPDEKPGAVTELENLKKDLQGKDKKITEMVKQIRELEERLTASGADGETRAAEAKKLAEAAGVLKERERTLAQQQEALREAQRLGVPPALLMRNAQELDSVISDLAEMERTILLKHGWQPGRAPEKRRLSAEDVAKFSRGELGRIPTHILDKLGGLNE